MGNPLDVTALLDGIDAGGPSAERLHAEIPKEDQDDEQIFDLTKATSIAQRELLRSIFQAALHLNASDVHFKMDEDEFYVDYRVDGDVGNYFEYQVLVGCRTR